MLAGDERPLAQRPPVRQRARLAAVEVAHERVRVEAVGGVVDLSPAKARVAAVAGGVRRRAPRPHAGHVASRAAAAVAASCECGLVACKRRDAEGGAEAEPSSRVVSVVPREGLWHA